MGSPYISVYIISHERDQHGGGLSGPDVGDPFVDACRYPAINDREADALVFGAAIGTDGDLMYPTIAATDELGVEVPRDESQSADVAGLQRRLAAFRDARSGGNSTVLATWRPRSLSRPVSCNSCFCVSRTGRRSTTRDASTSSTSSQTSGSRAELSPPPSASTLRQQSTRRSS
jgi:hypothetical protein